ncbi:DMT family transporter [Bacillus sp. Marseille-P3661]|uniref:DMT family transporter n=1 Tax=Bacillus sp. Marseille-P3661 TaxID=1936234 RepID=UPI000C834BA4|nr:multidrug efflux SMR transporter [Bacillus sp. Marseille-P3661]
MAWVALIAAGFCEIFGVTMINKFNQDRKWTSLLLLTIGFIASFILLSFAMVSIPMSTAYAIWTGIGAAGATVIGMFFYGEAKDWKRIVFISMILCSVIGLKLIS